MWRSNPPPRPATPSILSELRRQSSPAKQAGALRVLKNEIIGHEQRKRYWISLGIITHLSHVLELCHPGNGRPGSIPRSPATSYSHQKDDEEYICLQAVIIVGSLANEKGGPAYLLPLEKGLVFPHLLNLLRPGDSSPRLVLACLRTLNAIANSIALEKYRSSKDDKEFVRLVYSDQHLTSLSYILDQNPSDSNTRQQIYLASSLIYRIGAEEPCRKLLAGSGILNSLAKQLAIFIANSDPSSLRLKRLDRSYNSQDPLPHPFALAPILQAICAIITDSKERTAQFVSAIPLTQVLLTSTTTYSHAERYQPRDYRLREWAVPADGSIPSRQTTFSPSIQPVVSNIAPSGKHNRKARDYPGVKDFGHADEISVENESPLIPWLIEVLRIKSGFTRLMVAWTLSLLFRADQTSKDRERGFSMLLVPVLVQMLDNEPSTSEEESCPYDVGFSQANHWTIHQLAPRILALLVVESPDLQKAAFDSGAIRKLSQLLKQSYDPLPKSQASIMWSPETDQEASQKVVGPESKLGPNGLHPLLFHTLQMRSSILTALGAMATFKDEYRKAIIDNGIMPFVIESMKPCEEPQPDVLADNQALNNGPQLVGNPISVLLAACGAARALSRSVSTLRTSLMDAGLAAPLYILLRHPELDVQVAATTVICNIVLEFSPMRDAVLDAGVLKILCEHAHSPNPRLRLNSLWALKHLVNSAPNTLKIVCVQELGPSWLKRVISMEHCDQNMADDSLERVRGASIPSTETPNTAGEQVDLLNTASDAGQSYVQGTEDDDDEVNMIDSTSALSRPEQRQRYSRLPNQGDYEGDGLDAAVQYEFDENDPDLIEQSKKDASAVQEQGLDFIRNLICGTDSHEMVDYLFKELGEGLFFDMLTQLLRPRTIDVYDDAGRISKAGPRHVLPQSEIVSAVCYIVVNLAASLPRHRQLLISHTELLKLIIPLFAHPLSDIRLCCLFIVINLTWPEDQSDKLQCKSRATELSKLGVYEHLRKLESDPNLDVRERTKIALLQMNDLLG